MGDNFGSKQTQAQMLNYKQAIDQGFSHDILFQLLSTAESYALGSENPDRQFKGYEYFNSSSKSKRKLKEQFLIQTDTFRNSYTFFCYDHERYDFPSNLSKELVIKLMEYWKSCVEDIKDKEIYDKTIRLLLQEKHMGGIKVGNNKYYKNKDLNDVEMGNLQEIMSGVNYSNQALAEDIKKNMDKTGKYTGHAKLGAKSTVDPIIAKFYEKGDISKAQPGKKYQTREDESDC